MHADFPDHSASRIIQVDRHIVLSGKKKMRWNAVIVNERFAIPTYYHERMFSGHQTSFLLVPGMFSAVLISVCVPPSDDKTAICDVMHATVAKLQSQHPETFVTIILVFNPSLLIALHRKIKLDLLYTNIKKVYRATALHHLANRTPVSSY